MKRLTGPQSLLLLLIAAAAALPLALGGAYLWHKRQWAQERLAELEPRHARLLGLEASAEPLRAARAQSQALLAQYVYAAQLDASQVGNDAQQRVRDLFSAAGLQMLSSQVLPAKAQGLVDRVPLSVRTEGELLALQSALALLSGQRPAIVVDALDVQTLGLVRADAPQKLSVRFDLFVLRARPS